MVVLSLSCVPEATCSHVHDNIMRTGVLIQYSFFRSPVVQGSVGHIRFAMCAERSRDNRLRFLRKFQPDKIWNTLITITYLHR